MKKILTVFIILSISIASAQKADPSFAQFKNNYFGKNFKPVVALSAPAVLIRTGYDFKLSSSQRKPMFCRMEDKLCNKFNIWLQLRAGSDQDYRKLAFPEEINKTKRMIE